MWGLKNCDTCRRARHWLTKHDITFEFHDVRELTPDHARLSRWLKAVGTDILINRRGTTWRSLPDSAKRQIESGVVLPILEQYPALMKRPILEYGRQMLVGFDETRYKMLQGKS